MKYLPEVRAAIVKACPEIEQIRILGFINVFIPKMENRQRATVLAIFSDMDAGYRKKMRLFEDGKIRDRYFDETDFTVDPRPIRLADVLRAIGDKRGIGSETIAVDQHGFFLEENRFAVFHLRRERWELQSDSLDEQSTETIAFLHSVLCV